MNSSSDHSIVVYTPALLDPEAGIRTFNITLPEGTFCSDIMIDPSKRQAFWHTCIPCNDYTQALLACMLLRYYSAAHKTLRHY